MCTCTSFWEIGNLYELSLNIYENSAIYVHLVFVHFTNWYSHYIKLIEVVTTPSLLAVVCGYVFLNLVFFLQNMIVQNLYANNINQHRHDIIQGTHSPGKRGKITWNFPQIYNIGVDGGHVTKKLIHHAIFAHNTQGNILNRTF